MNSRTAHRNAKALAGSCAFVHGPVPLLAGPQAVRPLGLRESEDRPSPGDSRV